MWDSREGASGTESGTRGRLSKTSDRHSSLAAHHHHAYTHANIFLFQNNSNLSKQQHCLNIGHVITGYWHMHPQCRTSTYHKQTNQPTNERHHSTKPRTLNNTNPSTHTRVRHPFNSRDIRIIITSTTPSIRGPLGERKKENATKRPKPPSKRNDKKYKTPREVNDSWLVSAPQYYPTHSSEYGDAEKAAQPNAAQPLYKCTYSHTSQPHPT